MQFHKTLLFNKNVNSIYLALLAGVLLGISWPPMPLGPLLCISFVPLFFVLDECKTLKDVFFYSFLAFFIWALSTMYWIGNIVIKDPTETIIYLAFILIPVIMTFPLLLWRILGKNMNKYASWLLLPFYWTAYEFLHSKGDLAFNWLDIGFGLSKYPWLIGFYRYTGIYGGTFICMLINVLLFLGIKYASDRKIRNRIFTGIATIFTIILLTDAVPSGHSSGSSEKVRVAAVQSNTDVYTPLDEHSLYAQFDTLKSMILPLKDQHLNLIVCSEGYFRTNTRPILLNNIENDTLIKLLKQLSLQMNAPILTGIIVQKVFYTSSPSVTATKIKEGMYYDSYNAALLISHDENTRIYTKNKLVPFMERTPLLGWFSFLEKFHFSLNQMKKSYSSIPNPSLFTYGNMKIDPVICLEATFSDYVSEFVKKGANMIVVITNDGWSGNTSGYMQGAEYALPLSVEAQRPIVRCANTGVSEFIQNGHITQLGIWQEKKVVIDDVTLNNSYSFFVKYGNIISFISLTVTICTLAFFVVMRIIRN